MAPRDFSPESLSPRVPEEDPSTLNHSQDVLSSARKSSLLSASYGGPCTPPPPPGSSHIIKHSNQPSMTQQQGALHNSIQLKDLTLQEPIENLRKNLTTYMLWTIRKQPDMKKDSIGTWAKVQFTCERSSQSDIARAIRSLNKNGKKTTTTKKAELFPFQSQQVNKVLDDQATQETDPKFEWSLAQLDRDFKINKQLKQETLVIYVYLKRSPRIDLTIEDLRDMETTTQHEFATDAASKAGTKQPSRYKAPLQKQNAPPRRRIGRRRTRDDSSDSSGDSFWDTDSDHSTSSISTHPSTMSGNSGDNRQRSYGRSDRVGTKMEPTRSPPPDNMPVSDPVAAAYKAGRVDAEAERYGLTYAAQATRYQDLLSKPPQLDNRFDGPRRDIEREEYARPVREKYIRYTPPSPRTEEVYRARERAAEDYVEFRRPRGGESYYDERIYRHEPRRRGYASKQEQAEESSDLEHLEGIKDLMHAPPKSQEMASKQDLEMPGDISKADSPGDQPMKITSKDVVPEHVEVAELDDGNTSHEAWPDQLDQSYEPEHADTCTENGDTEQVASGSKFHFQDAPQNELAQPSQNFIDPMPKKEYTLTTKPRHQSQPMTSQVMQLTSRLFCPEGAKLPLTPDLVVSKTLNQNITYTPWNLVSGPNISDHLKGAIEKYLKYPVVWWPMAPRKTVCPQGHVRLSWRCDCGEQLYVDIQDKIIQVNIDQVTTTEQTTLDSPEDGAKTQATPQTTVASSPNLLPTYNTPSSASGISSPPGSVQNNTGNSMTQRSPYSSNSSPNPNNPAASHPQQASIINNLIRDRYLHWCVDESHVKTHLFHLPVPRMNDRSIIRDMRSKYQSVTRFWGWFSLTECYSVKFVNFKRINRLEELVACGSEDLPCPKTDHDYRYQYEDPRELFIKTLERTLMHHFYSPFGCNAQDIEDLLSRVPMKVNGRLEKKMWAKGYGLYALSGYAFWKLVLVLTLSQIPPIVFAAVWLCRVPGDLQNAFLFWGVLSAVVIGVLNILLVLPNRSLQRL